MIYVTCAYCTGDAIGVDEDGNLTCGCPDSCMWAVAPLPDVIEVSDDEDEDEGEDDEDD